jgi:transposase
LPVMGPPLWLHGIGPIACYAAPRVGDGRCCVGYREVSVVEIREVLRLWVRGHGLRAIARLAMVDRKTVRRYVEAARTAGLLPGHGEGAITDELIGQVVELVRPARPFGHGAAWDELVPHRSKIEGWLKQDLKVTKIHDLLERKGVSVPYRTLHRYCTEELGYFKGATTVRLADGEPGKELQADFARMGLVSDPATGRRRVAWALIFTAVYSRHTFVFLTFRQSIEAVIEGFDAAWAFFEGVFAVVIPDNMKAIVDQADATDPRFNAAFLEYAQARGFVVDPARVRSPRDKAKVERSVQFVRESFFRGEEFPDIADAQGRADAWCRGRAGMRVHGTTQARPLEVFEARELPLLRPAPEAPYDLPIYAKPKVHLDHHVEVAKALYSVPGGLIGQRVQARADRHLVRISHQGRLVKVHPRQPVGGRSTDAEDLPQEKVAYAMRDLDRLKRTAAGAGASVGVYATRLLDTELPWTRMRQVYRLLGLARRYGSERVEQACSRALELDVVDVTRIARMLEQALEGKQGPPARVVDNVVPLRFARDPSEFGTGRRGGDDER